MTTIPQMIADAEALIARVETLRLRNTIASHAFVVLSASDFALDFDLADNGDGTRTATNAHMVALYKARQFTRRDATTLAAACTDGKGRPARAVHINEAVNVIQAAQREFIATLKSVAA